MSGCGTITGRQGGLRSEALKKQPRFATIRSDAVSSKRRFFLFASHSTWNLTATTKFVYDGWNLIAERVTPVGGAETGTTYVWGLDLSQSVQGAGGIGGLLLQEKDDATGQTKTRLYTYEANGNVGQLVDGTTGAVVAHYEYDPFGTTLTASGTDANANPFRFSTKYTDDETTLVYYGYRFYSPTLGRWLTRDPIEEAGGFNIYAIGKNNVINEYDLLGLIFSKFVEERLRNDFAPLVYKYFESHRIYRKLKPECAKLLQAAVLKFIGEEYSDRTRTKTKERLNDIQDYVVSTGLLHPSLLPYKFINPEWKKGTLVEKMLTRLHPAYNDIGPANIEPKTVLERVGVNPATVSELGYRSLARVLTSDRGVVMIMSQLALDTLLELVGHFSDQCCTYDRRSVQLIVNMLREGQENYWNRVKESPRSYRYLLEESAFEEWKRDPQRAEIPLLLENMIKPLSPGNLDDDEFRFIEELIGVTIQIFP